MNVARPAPSAPMPMNRGRTNSGSSTMFSRQPVIVPYDLVASSVIASEPTIASSWSLKKNASDENRMPARIEL